MTIEVGRTGFPEKYPRGDITCSLPVREDRFFVREKIPPKKTHGVHVIYQGENGLFFEDAYPHHRSYGPVITPQEYEETLREYKVPLPATAYKKERDIWVGGRKQLVEVESRARVDTGERKVTMRRQEERPAGILAVESGVELVAELVNEHGFDPYDVTYLTGGTRNTIEPTNLVDKAFALGEDAKVRNARGENGSVQKIIRAVVFKK